MFFFWVAPLSEFLLNDNILFFRLDFLTQFLRISMTFLEECDHANRRALHYAAVMGYPRVIEALLVAFHVQAKLQDVELGVLNSERTLAHCISLHYLFRELLFV